VGTKERMDETITKKVIETDSNISKSRKALYGELIQDKENIAKLSREWDKLFSRAKYASVFLSRAWIQTFIDEGHFKGKPCFIAVWNGTKLVALLPLAIQNFCGIRIGKLIGTEEPSYLGLLLDQSYPEAVAVVAETWISENVAHVFHDKHVFSSDEATKKLVTELNKRSFSYKYDYERICHGIELGCTFEQYFNKFKSAKSRQTMRRKERKLVENRDVKLQYYEGNQIIAEVLERIAQIQEESWMKRRGAAVLGQSFYRKLLKNMAQAGLACVWLMTIDDCDAAFVYAFKSHGKLNYHWPAFKLKYESGLSVGQILLMWIIRDACEQKITYFDFEHGEGQYKRFWANQTNNVLWVVAAKGFLGSIIILCYRITWKLAQQKFLRSLYKRIRK
jgi:CelD/BcsL family acetyltransferase involved in cellulose biosynthesis